MKPGSKNSYSSLSDLEIGGKKYKYLYLHQMRVEVDDEDINPVPEGIHQDLSLIHI